MFAWDDSFLQWIPSRKDSPQSSEFFFFSVLLKFFFLCYYSLFLAEILFASSWRILLKKQMQEQSCLLLMFTKRIAFVILYFQKKKLRYEMCFHHFNRGTWGHVNELGSSAAVDKNVFCFHTRDWFMKKYRWGFVWSFNMNLETACGKIMGILQKTLPSHLSCLGILWGQEEVTPTGDFTSSTVLQKVWYCTLPGKLGGCLVRMENTNVWANVSCLPLLLHKARFLDSVSQVGFFTYALMQNKVWRRDDRIYTAL